MRTRLTPEAEADVAQALAWYRERSSGLAADFLACVDAALRRIEEFPQIAPVVHATFRRALLRRFPYCLFYSIEGDEAVVVGCFHAHRSPEAWRLRAGESPGGDVRGATEEVDRRASRAESRDRSDPALHEDVVPDAS